MTKEQYKDSEGSFLTSLFGRNKSKCLTAYLINSCLVISRVQLFENVHWRNVMSFKIIVRDFQTN